MRYLRNDSPISSHGRSTLASPRTQTLAPVLSLKPTHRTAKFEGTDAALYVQLSVTNIGLHFPPRLNFDFFFPALQGLI